MRPIHFLYFVVLTFSCTKTNIYFENFNFGQNAYIKVTITNCDLPTYFEFYSNHVFPNHEFKYHTTIYKDTSFLITVPSNIYRLSFIKVDKESFTDIYTQPNDTLNLEINLDREEKIKLEGTSDMIYQYYKAKKNNWKKTNGNDYYYDSTISILEFANKFTYTA